MALANTTSSSALRSGTLPISLRYMRTGSSMPTMSAAIASSSSWVEGLSVSSSAICPGGSSQGCFWLSSTETDTPSSAAAPKPGGAPISSSASGWTRSASRSRLPRSSTDATSSLSVESVAMGHLRCGSVLGGSDASFREQGCVFDGAVQLETASLQLEDPLLEPVDQLLVARGLGVSQLAADVLE